MSNKNIFDNIEKLGKEEDTTTDIENLTEKEKNGVLLIISYEGNEQEVFYMEKEPGIEAVKRMFELLKGPLPKVVALQNNSIQNTIDIDPGKIEDFRAIITLSKSIRSIRLLSPSEILDKNSL
jgi:hypothetical protein